MKKIIIIALTILILLLPLPAFAQQWWSSSWLYRLPIEISHQSGFSLTNYPVNISANTASLISAGKMRSDCGDIRFIDSGGSILFDYWLESGCNSATTLIWVNVSSIPSGTSDIYMYYGNSGAASISSQANVCPGGSPDNYCYLVYDDFTGSNGATPNSNIWTIINTATAVDIQSNQLRLRGNGWNSLQLETKRRFGPPLRIEYDVYPHGLHSGGYECPQCGGAGSDYPADMRLLSSTETEYAKVYFEMYYTCQRRISTRQAGGSADRVTTSGNSKTWYHVTADINQTQIKVTVGDWSPASVLMDQPPQDSKIVLAGAGGDCGPDDRWDNFQIRKYLSPEPSVVLLGEENNIPPQITITSPVNNSIYNIFNVDLKYGIYDINNDSVWYSLDSKANTTLTAKNVTQDMEKSKIDFAKDSNCPNSFYAYLSGISNFADENWDSMTVLQQGGPAGQYCYASGYETYNIPYFKEAVSNVILDIKWYAYLPTSFGRAGITVWVYDNVSFSWVQIYSDTKTTIVNSVYTANISINPSYIDGSNIYFKYRLYALTPGTTAVSGLYEGQIRVISIYQPKGFYNTTLYSLSEGFHNVTIYANDTAGNINKSTVFFTVDTPPPQIAILSPINNTVYNTTNLNLKYTVIDMDLNDSWYSVDSMSNSTPKYIIQDIESDASVSGSFGSPGSSYDENWNSYSMVCDWTGCPSGGSIYENFTFPDIIHANNITLEIKTGATIYSTDAAYVNVSVYNFTSGAYTLILRKEYLGVNNFNDKVSINKNYLYNNTVLKIRTVVWIVNGDSGVSSLVRHYENQILLTYRNLTNLSFAEGYHNITVYANDSAGNVNKSTAFFTVVQYPSNVGVDTGNDGKKDIQLSGDLVSTQTAGLNKTAIQEYLKTCTADAQGYCLLPLNVSSSSAGIVELGGLNIEHTSDFTREKYKKIGELSDSVSIMRESKKDGKLRIQLIYRVRLGETGHFIDLFSEGNKISTSEITIEKNETYKTKINGKDVTVTKVKLIFT